MVITSQPHGAYLSFLLHADTKSLKDAVCCFWGFGGSLWRAKGLHRTIYICVVISRMIVNDAKIFR